MRMHRLSISIALLTALLGLSVGCSQHPNDDAIARNIQTKVAAKPDTKDSDVSVTAKDGKVTLTGKVKTPCSFSWQGPE
jgi:osmotically-inducible protein OsmY